MRRRRKTGAWLPVNPTFVGDSSFGRTYYDFGDTLSGTADVGTTVQRAVPLTMDETPELDAGLTYTMSDYVQGQEYLLERVVGKIFCMQGQSSEQAVVRTLACAALAVLPTQEGADQPDLPPEEWNPFFSQNSQQPWIWRREWLLGFAGGGDFDLPHSNMQYGSVADGPHIDTKGAKRRIGKEQRLYGVFAAVILNRDENLGTDPTTIRWVYDLRLFGAMRRARSRSGF